MSVESHSKLNYPIAILLREFVYKQLFYVIPLYILISYFKLGWLSPYFEILYCFILTLILYIFSLFRKKTWYDRWANTIVVKNPEYNDVRARKGIRLLMSILLVIAGIRIFYYVFTNTFNDPFIPKHSKRTISTYVSFLKKQQGAKDYIFRLFEKNDIVILCERDHPEMTQYNFISDLVSDNRFIENAGNIFTGYIFYKPLEEHYISVGFKNIIASGFDEEILNRAAIIDDHSLDSDNNIKSVKKKLEKLRKQEITINSEPYQIFASVIDLLFGSALLILGLASGLVIRNVKYSEFGNGTAVKMATRVQ